MLPFLLPNAILECPPCGIPPLKSNSTSNGVYFVLLFVALIMWRSSFSSESPPELGMGRRSIFPSHGKFPPPSPSILTLFSFYLMTLFGTFVLLKLISYSIDLRIDILLGFCAINYKLLLFTFPQIVLRFSYFPLESLINFPFSFGS